MSKSFSVKAILSAKDSGFSSTLKSCSEVLDKIDSKLSGFSFGILSGAGQKAFNAISDSVSGLVSEIDSSNAAWKTFEGNMGILGKNKKDISDVKKELQSFAQQTIYSASDMANTYAQLEAVGVESTLGLVKGFGGLAAASEDPKQAMKTLSQQATQMAGKPTAAWADFKLILEQTPAGVAAVAKQMGMTTSELVAKIQDGKVATKDFFSAIEAVGTSKGFTDMATQYKTAGQAMDGLSETLGNKLMPAYELASQTAIKGIEKIINKADEIDVQKIVNEFSKGLKSIGKYWNAFTSAFSDTKTDLTETFLAVKSSMAELKSEFGSTESVKGFRDTMESVANVIKKVANFATKHSDAIAWIITNLPQIALAIKGFSVAKKVAPFVGTFASGISALASKGLGGIASKLLNVGKAQKTVGKTSRTSGNAMLQAAKSYALMGVAVLAIAAGFALLAFSAIQLSNAGGLAIGTMAGLVVGIAALGVGMAMLLKFIAPVGAKLMTAATAMLTMGAAVLIVSVGFAILAASAIALSNAGGLAIGIMAGMVAAIALLAVGAAVLGPTLAVGAAGLIAFGAAMILVGTGAVLAGAALAIVSAVLPSVAAYGLQGSLAIAALGGTLIVFATGAALAGVASITLGVGLIVATAGMLLFTAGMVAGAAGTLVMAGALKLVSSQMKTIASSAKKAEKTLGKMLDSVDAVKSGLNALESKVESALDTVKDSFDNTAKQVKISGKNMGMWFASEMKPGFTTATNNVKAATTTIVNTLNNSVSKAKSAGKNTGSGYSSGLKSGLNSAKSEASSAVNSVVSRLNSGYSSAYSAGAYMGSGFVNGIRSQISAARAAGSTLAAAADRGIRTKAIIHSPSKLTEDEGEYFGEGWVGGILAKVKDAKRAAEQLITVPSVRSPRLAGNFGMELSEDFDYYRNVQYTIIVPVELDGRETARVIAPYTEEELNRRQIRDSRKRGKV